MAEGGYMYLFRLTRQEVYIIINNSIYIGKKGYTRKDLSLNRN